MKSQKETALTKPPSSRIGVSACAVGCYLCPLPGRENGRDARSTLLLPLCQQFLERLQGLFGLGTRGNELEFISEGCSQR